MLVYAVFRQAVYRHACGGVFKPLKDAINAANSLADSDVDSHHVYEVVPYELGARAQTERSGDPQWPESPEILEADPVYQTRLGDTAGDRAVREEVALNGRA